MDTREFTEYLAARGRADEMLALLNKLGFGVDFVAANVLTGSAPVTIARVAMLWQGMPNKHDRKRTRQLFDALADVGLLRPAGDDETWVPIGPPD